MGGSVMGVIDDIKQLGARLGHEKD